MTPLHRSPKIKESLYCLDNIGRGEAWRRFRISSEFIEGFDALAELQPPAVTIFGSAHADTGHLDYIMATELTNNLSELGYAVITGGDSGIMEAANRSTTEADGLSIGLHIDLPREQSTNPYVNLPLAFRYFFFVKSCL